MKISPIIVLGGLFVVAGMAAPSLKTLVPADEHPSSASSEVYAVALGVRDRAKTVSTESRMNELKASMRVFYSGHGTPPDQLTDFVGAESTLDAWGHTMRYNAPTQYSPGLLRSAGPDGKWSSDDIKMPVTLKELE